jgi:cellulose synthase/poly-beta-1,6-N-acetylglucosamine synthase-like glycosyltransferase
MPQLLLSICFLLFIAYAALIIFYAYGWRQIPGFTLPPQFTPATNITVIIPARNEADNIGACLTALQQQNYPGQLLEIIVVDDFSTDDTAAIVQQHKDIILIQLKDFITAPINSYKKKAIEIAVQQAKGTLIVTTDADCIAPSGWLQTIAAFYQQYNSICIAMPVSINCTMRFIEVFQAIDFMTLQGITGASVYKKIHSMANGANMAYTKAAFNSVQGFSGINDIASGDDMLLIHKMYLQQPDKVQFLKSQNVIVQTQPVTSITDFLNQRIRWASKADKYNDKRIFTVLVVVYLLNTLLLLLPIIALFKNFDIAIGSTQFTLLQGWLLLLTLKTIVELFFLLPVSKFFNRQSLLWLFPLLQIPHIAYTVIAGWLGKFGNYTWKNRHVK